MVDTRFKKGQIPWNKNKRGIYSEEVRKKMSEAHKGKKLSEEHKLKLKLSRKNKPSYMQGKHHSNETKLKMSLAKKGKRPKNIKYFLSVANKFKKGQTPWNKGVPISEEAKKKMIETKKNKKPKEFICSICGKKWLTKTWNRKWCDDCKKSKATWKVIKEYRHQPEIRARINAYKKIYRQKPEVKVKERKYSIISHSRRYQRDLYFRKKMNLRRRLLRVLRDYTKTGKIMKSRQYGIDYNKIIAHLMKIRPEGVIDQDLMDYKKWHIDHIRPLASFDLNNLEEVKKAFAPENHQWLTAEENIRKSNKLNWRIK